MSAETEFFSKGLAVGITDSLANKMLWRFRHEDWQTTLILWDIVKMPVAPIETIRSIGKRIA